MSDLPQVTKSYSGFSPEQTASEAPVPPTQGSATVAPAPVPPTLVTPAATPSPVASTEMPAPGAVTTDPVDAFPPITPSQPPIYATPPAEAPKGRSGLWIALAAVVALLIGVGLGYAASQPAKNDVVAERDQALEQITQLEDQVEQLEDQKGTAEETAAEAGSARDTCSKAATDANDLVDQIEHQGMVYDQWMAAAPGSDEEAQLSDQLDTGNETINTQLDIVRDELAECKAAVNA